LLFTVQKQFFHSFHGCPAFRRGFFFNAVMSEQSREPDRSVSTVMQLKTS